MKFAFIRAATFLLAAIIASAALAQAPSTTRPNISNVLTQCAINYPVLGNGVGLTPICGPSALGTNAYSSVAFAPIASPTFTGTVTIPSGSVLNTPTSINLSNATSLPVSTGINGLGTGVATALGNAANATGGFTTIDGTATLTNKTFNCANNTCTVRIASDVSGLGTGVATALGTAVNTNGGPLTGTTASVAAGAIHVGAGSGTAPTGVNITGLVLGNGASNPSAYAGTTAGANQFMTGLSASGVGTFAQPSTANLSTTVNALLLGNGSTVGAYGGATSCTNQFMTGLSSAGASTCTTVAAQNVTACVPVTNSYTTGTNTTYTTPSCGGVRANYIEIDIQGGGGGGAGSGTSPGATSAGGDTCWNTGGTACTTPVYDAGGGGAGVSTNLGFGAGGTTSGSGSCDIAITGGAAGYATNSASVAGGLGGASSFGGAGFGGLFTSSNGGPGTAAQTNSGSGGGGASAGSTAASGSGGGAGARCMVRVSSPAATYVYTVGAAGTAGTAGTGGSAGGAGAVGRVIVTARWQ